MLREIDLDLLEPHPYWRGRTDCRPLPEDIERLRSGTVQPPTVRLRRDGGTTTFELLNGVEQWHAAQLIGIPKLLVFVREDLDTTAAEQFVHGEDYRRAPNPIARARALKQLLNSNHALTESALAKHVGCSIHTVSHLLRLLALPGEVVDMIEEGSLSYGHGRALAGLNEVSNQVALANIIRQHRLSVRVAERAVRAIVVEGVDPREAWQNRAPAVSGRTTAPVAERQESSVVHDPNITWLEDRLAEALGTTVEIEHHSDGGGALHIRYFNLDVLDGITEKLLPRED